MAPAAARESAAGGCGCAAEPAVSRGPGGAGDLAEAREELIQGAAGELSLLAGEVELCEGARKFNVREGGVSLQALGIGEGAVLNCICHVKEGLMSCNDDLARCAVSAALQSRPARLRPRWALASAKLAAEKREAARAAAEARPRAAREGGHHAKGTHSLEAYESRSRTMDFALKAGRAAAGAAAEAQPCSAKEHGSHDKGARGVEVYERRRRALDSAAQAARTAAEALPCAASEGGDHGEVYESRRRTVDIALKARLEAPCAPKAGSLGAGRAQPAAPCPSKGVSLSSGGAAAPRALALLAAVVHAGCSALAPFAACSAQGHGAALVCR